MLDTGHFWLGRSNFSLLHARRFTDYSQFDLDGRVAGFPLTLRFAIAKAGGRFFAGSLVFSELHQALTLQFAAAQYFPSTWMTTQDLHGTRVDFRLR